MCSIAVGGQGAASAVGRKKEVTKIHGEVFKPQGLCLPSTLPQKQTWQIQAFGTKRKPGPSSALSCHCLLHMGTSTSHTFCGPSSYFTSLAKQPQ